MAATIAPDDAVAVAFGGNLPGPHGRPEEVVEQALARFGDEGLKLIRRSRLWRSAAWPDPSEPAFVNGVALVETSLTPRETLAALHRIEAGFGRTRGRANAPRVLDLDLIAFGRLVLDTPELTLPHPRAAERLFVMGPLAEVAPEWRHPVTGRTAAELASSARLGRDASPLKS